MGKFKRKKARVGVRGSTSQIPPFYPLLRCLGKMSCVTHGVITPRVIYTGNDRGSGPAC
jgi:hypothetical protein